MSTRPHVMVNRWQRGVPLVNVPVVTPLFLLFSVLAAIGIGISLFRLVMGLGLFSNMNYAYAWGIWKTFNAMTLTALGSGGFAVGILAWVLYREKFHLVMRASLLLSLLFYLTGLFAIGIDVGRPWNMWNLLLPWRWNLHSSLFEVMVCMPAYAIFFLAFENLPPVLEYLHRIGSEELRTWIKRATPALEKLYPWMVAGAYVLPAMHQSSLGALLLLAGPKVHPLWQSQLLPLFYLIQAAICGFACTIFALMAACLYWRRPLDMDVLSDLGLWMSRTSILFILLRCVDILWRGQVAAAYQLTEYVAVFHLENFLILSPALILLVKEWRNTPKILFQASILTALGGMLYRFAPTTIAYIPGEHITYFPSVIEILITLGYISLVIVVFSWAVKRLAILPGSLSEWYKAEEYWEKNNG